MSERIVAALAVLLVAVSVGWVMADAALTLEEFRAIKAAVARDPAFFSREILGYRPWEKQLEVKQAVRKGRRTMVLSGHGTGKTRTLADIICEAASLGPVRVVCTASTNKQVHKILWSEVRKLHAHSRCPLGGNIHDLHWRVDHGWDATPISVDDPTALQGYHGERVLVIVDEGEGVRQQMWGAINSLLSGGDARLVVCLNPVTASGYCYEQAKRRDLWKVINIDCLDHPNVVSGDPQLIPGAVTRRWIEEVVAAEDFMRLGEHPWEFVEEKLRSGEWRTPFTEARIRGRFPREGGKGFIPLAFLEDAAASGSQLGQRFERRIGIDVAHEGGDKNVLIVLDETLTVIHREAWSGEKIGETTGRLRNAMERWDIKPANAKVDAEGLGTDVVDRLAEQGIYVDAVKFGSGVRGDWPGLVSPHIRLANRKAELFWVARQLLKKRMACIPEKYGPMWVDLTSQDKEHTDRGELKVERKEKVRGKLGRSPDDGDAFLIALSNVGSDVGFGVY